MENFLDEFKRKKQAEEEKVATLNLISQIKDFLIKLFGNLIFEINKFKNVIFRVRVENQVEIPTSLSVNNFPKLSRVYGEVSVKNIRDLYLMLKNISAKLDKIKLEVPAVQRIEGRVKVENQPEINIPKVKLPEYPKSIFVNNLEEVRRDIHRIIEEIKKIDLNVVLPPFPKFNEEKIIKAITDLGKKLNNLKVPDIYIPEFPTKEIKDVQKAIENLKFPVPNPLPTFENNKGEPKRGLVDNDGHIQVDIVGGNISLETNDIQIGAVELKDGETDRRAPVTQYGLMVTTSNYTVKIVEQGNYTYVAKAPVGSSESEAVWQVKRIDESSGIRILWADGNDNFDNVATNLPSLSYS